MNSKNIVALSLIAIVLLAGSFISLAAAQDESVTAPPDQTTPPSTSEDSAPDSTDNSTASPSSDAILYTIQDNSTDLQREQPPQEPGTADGDLIFATNTAATPDYTLLIAGVAIVIAVTLGAVGVVYRRKKTAKA